MLKDHQDAFGHLFKDYLRGTADSYVIERDDGLIRSDPIKGYFNTYRHWPANLRKAMRYIRGRVLDVGCGAGRHALYLQEKGHDVVGIDDSPLAIEVCKERGLKDARVISTTQIGTYLGTFDTVIMFGGNFGLVGSFEGARRLLKRLDRVTSQNGRIIATCRDPYQTDNPDFLEYHERNRKKGRMAGQIRLRIRHGRYATPWIDWLIVSRNEMQEILSETSWRVKRFIESGGDAYIAIIDKTKG